MNFKHIRPFLLYIFQIRAGCEGAYDYRKNYWIRNASVSEGKLEHLVLLLPKYLANYVPHFW